MKKIFYCIIVFLTFYSIYLGSVSAQIGEVNFLNDVARDFLLLQELDAKKIVLIGPRSSTNGLFHGPLLTYINYPAYLIGGGDPAVVAWFWVALGIIFILTSFYFVRKLFGVLPALVYSLLLATRMIPHINSVFEPEAMYFFMPLFLYSIIMYAKTNKWKYLALHFITVGIFIHLSIGIGLQFLILSGVSGAYLIFRNKKWMHFASFLAAPIVSANFIIFDARHNFTMAKALLTTGGGSKFFITIPSWIHNRVENLVSLEALEGGEGFTLLPLIVFFFVLVFTIKRIRDKKSKDRSVYILLSFYYLGYLALSYFNKGLLLFHYVYLLVPLTYLWIVSFIRGKTLVAACILTGLIYAFNLSYGISFVKSINNFQKSPNSWRGLSKVAEYVTHKQKKDSFGYFVFAPDSFAYQPRYAMIFNFKKNKANAHEYTKENTTYVIAQPPPANDKYMDYHWWVKVPVRITSKAVEEHKFPNGYTVLKYELLQEEQKIPHDRSIEIGIHFR